MNHSAKQCTKTPSKIIWIAWHNLVCLQNGVRKNPSQTISKSMKIDHSAKLCRKNQSKIIWNSWKMLILQDSVRKIHLHSFENIRNIDHSAKQWTRNPSKLIRKSSIKLSILQKGVRKNTARIIWKSLKILSFRKSVY